MAFFGQWNYVIHQEKKEQETHSFDSQEKSERTLSWRIRWSFKMGRGPFKAVERAQEQRRTQGNTRRNGLTLFIITLFPFIVAEALGGAV